MISIKEQESLLVQIGDKLPKQIEIYAIGGTAMMLSGIKESTLDIDFVFTKNKERELFIEIAKSLGYREMNSRIVYGTKQNRPIMISIGDSRLDLFLDDVINTKFSDTMASRARILHRFGKNLVIKVADLHDIIIMKSATGRLKDEDDVLSILKEKEVDWKIIIEEASNQVEIGKEEAVLNLGRFFEQLSRKNKHLIPKKVLDELWELLQKQVSKKNKKD